jgi:hypothetical protein
MTFRGRSLGKTLSLRFGLPRGFGGRAAEVDNLAGGEPGVAELAAHLARERELRQEIVAQRELGFDGADVVGKLAGKRLTLGLSRVFVGI